MARKQTPPSAAGIAPTGLTLYDYLVRVIPRWLVGLSLILFAIIFVASFFVRQPFKAFGMEFGPVQVPSEDLLNRARTGPYVLTDADGKQRLRIGLDTAGEPSLTLWDRSGKPRFELGFTELGAYFSLNDREGAKRLAGAPSYEKGIPSLILFDQEGAVRFELRTNADGTPIFFLVDSNEQPLFRVEITPSGRPRIVVRDENGQEREVELKLKPQ